MIKLNLLTGRSGDLAERPMIMDEMEFWNYYLKLLNVRNNFSLSEREIRVMAYVLAHDYNKSHFKGEQGKELKRTLRISSPDLSKIKEKLIIKGYIENTGAMRGDAQPVRAIRDFQKYVKLCIEKDRPITINFVFPFKIEENAEH